MHTIFVSFFIYLPFLPSRDIDAALHNIIIVVKHHALLRSAPALIISVHAHQHPPVRGTQLSPGIYIMYVVLLILLPFHSHFYLLGSFPLLRWIIIVLASFPFLYGGPIALISVELSAAMPFDGGAVRTVQRCFTYTTFLCVTLSLRLFHLISSHRPFFVVDAEWMQSEY